jgi:hypothetical protein
MIVRYSSDSAAIKAQSRSHASLHVTTGGMHRFDMTNTVVPTSPAKAVLRAGSHVISI